MSKPFSLPAYAGIILQKNQKVFLIKRSNTNWMSGHWNFPGGLVDQDESLLQAATRETQEEVGVFVAPSDFELVHVLHVHKNKTNTQDIIGVYFRALHWLDTPKNNEPQKIADAQWFSLEQLPDDITEHALLAIKGLQEGTSYSESGW